MGLTSPGPGLPAVAPARSIPQSHPRLAALGDRRQGQERTGRFLSVSVARPEPEEVSRALSTQPNSTPLKDAAPPPHPARERFKPGSQSPPTSGPHYLRRLTPVFGPWLRPNRGGSWIFAPPSDPGRAPRPTALHSQGRVPRARPWKGAGRGPSGLGSTQLCISPELNWPGRPGAWVSKPELLGDNLQAKCQGLGIQLGDPNPLGYFKGARIFSVPAVVRMVSERESWACFPRCEISLRSLFFF